MNTKIRRQLEHRKRRIRFRLDNHKLENLDKPVFTASNIRYEIGDHDRGIAHGGIGAFHLLARRIGLIDAIDDKLHLLKLHLPCHESDHVLNFAYNALCDGTCLRGHGRDAVSSGRVPQDLSADRGPQEPDGRKGGASPLRRLARRRSNWTRSISTEDVRNRFRFQGPFLTSLMLSRGKSRPKTSSIMKNSGLASSELPLNYEPVAEAVGAVP